MAEIFTIHTKIRKLVDTAYKSDNNNLTKSLHIHSPYQLFPSRDFSLQNIISIANEG
jgi:hypothetical protein